MEQMERLLSVSEAAKLLGICDNTLRDWDIEGKFKATRTAGNHRRYSLDQVREHLDKNASKPVDLTVNAKINNFVSKWSEAGYLDGLSKQDSTALSILLENAESFNLRDNYPLFSRSQYLWLTQQMYLRSKFRKMVRLNPLQGPCGMVFYGKRLENGSASINSEPVVARTLKLEMAMFKGADFEKVKDIYADALAKSMDMMIIENLPKCNIENMLDCGSMDSSIGSFKNIYDYVVGPSEMIELLKTKSWCDGVDLIECPSILDSENFRVLSFAGKYPSNLFDNAPVFCPYVLFMTATGTVCDSVLTRVGWYVNK